MPPIGSSFCRTSCSTGRSASSRAADRRPATLIRLIGIARREQQLVALMDVGAPASSYTVISIPDPGVDLVGTGDDQLLPAYNRTRASFGADRYLLTNPIDDRATYVGVD